MVIVIDASNLVLGRLASETAKILLGKHEKVTAKTDEPVYIINADKAIITGDPKKTAQRYLQRSHIKVLTNPRRGPFHPKQPEDIVKRAVRGMIKFKSPSGRNTFKRLRVYVGTLKKYEGQAITFENSNANKTLSKRITVGELGRRLSTYGNKAHLLKSD
jgi:large subunit ribosomal protein L13